MKLSQLSPDAKQAVKQKRLAGRWRTQEGLRILWELDRLDESAESHKRNAASVIGAGQIGMFVTGLVSAYQLFQGGHRSDIPLMAGVLGAFGLLVFIGWRWKAAALASDVPDDIRLLIHPFLRMIAQDLDPEGKITIQLNLTAMNESKPKLTRDLGWAGGYTRKQRLYEEPLGTVRLPLANGSKAVLRIRTRYCCVVQKRSRGKKTKVKTKWSKSTRIVCLLIPGALVNWERAVLKPHGSSRRETAIFPKVKGKQAAGLERRWKWRSVGKMVEERVPPEEVLQLFVRLVAAKRRATAH